MAFQNSLQHSAKAVCCGCIDDLHLSEIVKLEGAPIDCTVCGSVDHPAITVERLGELLEPILRGLIEHGQDVKRFGEDDSEYWVREGDSLGGWIQEVLGQYFTFEDEIVKAVAEAEEYWPGDVDGPYWDTTSSYVAKRVGADAYLADWQNTLEELKHGQRFFSPSARSLFDRLFRGVDELKARVGKRELPVVRQLKGGTKIFRARTCYSRSLFAEIMADPLKHVGPVPSKLARAGRMNADGIAVCYAARDARTCIAEMRPALGGEVALIEMATTRPLRVIDLTRLDKARDGKSLSYFQPDYSDEVERRSFLRRLHWLISQPIVPGREADYLITQTMSEYLAHVHDRPFDGILFASVQKARGINLVLFAEPGLISDDEARKFRLSYVDKSLRLVSTASIRYVHSDLNFDVNTQGELVIWSPSEHFHDEEY